MKTTNLSVLLSCFSFLAVLPSVGCFHQDEADDDTSPDADAGTDADTDSDVDMDSDADSDTETDTGTDTGIDTDTYFDGCEGFGIGDGCIRFVDVDVAASGDGLTWAGAFRTVQEGIDSAHQEASGDAGVDSCHVWVAEGTYYIFVSSWEDTVQLKPGVSVYGGFSGEEEQCDERDFAEHETILNGANGPDESTRVYHVVTGSDDAVIDGFTITRGKAVSGVPENSGNGGGMLNVSVSPTVLHCIFLDNEAETEAGGAGIYNNTSASFIRGCSFVGNNYEGIANRSSNVQITDSFFSDNYGCGIEDYDGFLTITDCVFKDHYGDGIYISWGAASVSNCTFEDNGVGIGDFQSSSLDVTGCSFSGQSSSGIHNVSSDAHVSDCVFESNVGGYGGAIDSSESSTLEATNCLFRDNYSIQTGGAISNLVGSSATFTNSVFNHNSAGERGGVIYSDNSYSTFINCTFVGNSSVTGVDAIDSLNNSLTTIANCILWDGTAWEISSVSNSITNVTNSCVRGGYPGAGNIDDAPMFAGGDPDAGVDTGETDLHLQPGSPCIDSGDNGSLPPDSFDLDGDANTDETIPFDFEDNPRVVNTTVDMGAYEHPL